MTGRWPEDGLEYVRMCPVCGSAVQEALHGSLYDHAFGVAPGVWSMVRCADCGTCYLNPRPTQDTIGLAYARYYTHQASAAGAEGLVSSVRRGVANAYLNYRFGVRMPGAINGAHFAAFLFPRLRRYLDATYGRHLPSPLDDARRLLDIGCGNGEFLQCAAAMGWEAEGIDVDSGAISAAQIAGCRVRCASVDDLDIEPGSYHQIVMSHVIEHVPNPLALLTRSLDLLAPGGRLWLETPNINALGHRVFGNAWRGLEPPRHLVLFNRQSLFATLARAGFEHISFKSHPAVSLFMWEESRRILRSMSSAEVPAVTRPIVRTMLAAVFADYWSIIRPESSEFITCVAYRPGGGRPHQ